MSRCLVPAVLFVVLATACTDVGTPAPTPVDTGQRIDVVRQLRADLAEPAVALGRAGGRLEQVVRVLRTSPPDDPETRLATTAAVRTEELQQLADAIAVADGVTVVGDGPDADEAAAAWRDARTAAHALHEAADAELERVGVLATADAELLELVARWDEPGSRSQQLAALDDAATRADALSATLGASPSDAPCLGDLERRIAAAAFVAEATRELRGLVAAHQGNAFDRRRAELADDPFGLGVPLAEVTDPECWEAASATGRQATALEEALRALEAALNPADLEGETPG